MPGLLGHQRLGITTTIAVLVASQLLFGLVAGVAMHRATHDYGLVVLGIILLLVGAYFATAETPRDMTAAQNTYLLKVCRVTEKQQLGDGVTGSRWPRGAGWRKRDIHVHGLASHGFKGDYNQLIIQLGNADCDVKYREVVRLDDPAEDIEGNAAYRDALENYAARFCCRKMQ